MERLRHVARASGADPSALVEETAAALAGVAADDPVGLVPACLRLVERHPSNGPMWWMAARVLSAADPVVEAWVVAEELRSDPTSQRLVAELADDATVTLVGWPAQAAACLHRRGDLEVLVVDAGGEGSVLARRLHRAGLDAVEVADTGLAAAVAVSDLVVLEALAAGPTGAVSAAGSAAAAAVARHALVPVWLVAGTGRVLPERLWEMVLARLDASGYEPWDRAEEVVAADLVDLVIGPDGPDPPAAGLGRLSCPVAPELLRAVG